MLTVITIWEQGNFLVAFTQNIRREFSHPTDPDQAGTYRRLNTLNYNVRYNASEFSHIERQ
jgi:iron complex outermembrane recepter protein